ncbi:MAG: hypothetical protein Q4C30_06770 [Bacteroidia bacterium]|nr:hypothetical protein [Bacteroidia bacterium]
MKRYITIAMMVATSVAAMAQDYTDIERFGRNDAQGSARSQAMGGAFGALGGDMSVGDINPAGIGVYRASEFSLSLGVNTTKANTSSDQKFGSPVNGIGDTRVKLMQLGGVFNTSLIRQASGVVSHTFSIAYNRIADYDQSYTMHAKNSSNSLLDFFIADPSADNIYEGGLGWDSEMLFTYYEYEEPRLDADGNPICDANGDPIYDTHRVNVDHTAWDFPLENDDKTEISFDDKYRRRKIDISRHYRERGSKGSFNVAYAQNIANKLYWGVNIDFQSYNFKRNFTHVEKFDEEAQYGAPNKFRYNSRLDQDAFGVSFGAGVIYVPMPVLRLGLAIHSPTFFSVNEVYDTNFRAGMETECYPEAPFECDYNVTAPARGVFSLAGVIGRLAIISADYEFVGYKASKFRSEDNGDDVEFEQMNAYLKEDLKNVHKLRLGAEIKPVQILSLRAGYKMQSSPYADDLMYNDYKNRDITGGLGLRFSNIYLDFAYVNHKVVEDAFILPGSDYYYYDASPNPYKMENTSHRVTVTFGYRF